MKQRWAFEAVLSVALTLASHYALAVDWFEVGRTATATFYVDPASLRKSGDIVMMWDLMDLNAPQLVSGAGLRSAKKQGEYDCEGRRSRTVRMLTHSGAMGTGSVTFASDELGKWSSIVPGSIEESIWKLACGAK